MSTTITNETLINWTKPIALEAKGRLTEEEIAYADKWATDLAVNRDYPSYHFIKEEIEWYLELLENAINKGKHLNVYKLHTLLKKLQSRIKNDRLTLDK